MTARAALDSYIESLQILARTEPGDRTDEEQALDAERRAALIDGQAHELVGQIRRVRALHREEYGCCEHCTGLYGVPYPCPTILALDDPEAQRATTEGDPT